MISIKTIKIDRWLNSSQIRCQEKNKSMAPAPPLSFDIFILKIQTDGLDPIFSS